MKNTIRKRSQKRRTVKNQKRRIGGNPENCSICLCEMNSPYTDSKSCILHYSGNIPHVFHTECILQLLNSRRNDENGIECPICRQTIQEHEVRAGIETIQTYGVSGLYLITLDNFVKMIFGKIKHYLRNDVRNVAVQLLQSDIAMVAVPFVWLVMFGIMRELFPNNRAGSTSRGEIPKLLRSKSLPNKSASRSLKRKSVTPQSEINDLLPNYFKDLIQVKKINENTCIKETSRNKELYEVVISAEKLNTLYEAYHITNDELREYMNGLEKTLETNKKYQKIKNMYIFGNIL
jgi:hypothetical protein